MTKKDKFKKKVYRGPRLVTYGAIGELTQAIANMQMLDGGAVMGMRRSSFTAMV